MATKVDKLNSGNYRVRASYVDETGKQRFKSFTAGTPKEAKYMAMQYEVDRKHKAKPENVSLKESIERYISNRENILSPSTIIGYEQLKRNAYSSIINLRLGNINKELVQQAINEYSRDHSSKSVRNALGLLNAVFKEYYKSIDTEGVILPQKKKTELEIPTTEQVKNIIQASRGSELYLPILFGAMLGMRRSEIFALTWNDINLNNNTVIINKAVVRDKNGAYVLKEVKTTNSERKLALFDLMLEEINKKSKAEPLINIKVDTFSQSYRRLCNRIGVPTSFHSLRHYNASIMLSEGVPNKYAQERLGHATDDMLKKVYQHLFDEKNTTVSNKIEKFFNENLDI